MGHSLWLHFGVDEHPFATYFDVRQGYRVLTHSHVFVALPVSSNPGVASSTNSHRAAIEGASPTRSQLDSPRDSSKGGAEGGRLSVAGARKPGSLKELPSSGPNG